MFATGSRGKSTRAKKATMPDRNQGDEFTNKADAASYVAALSADLASIARKHGLITLGYLLDMAQMEAENETRLANSSD